VQSDKPSNNEGLSDTAAASAKPKKQSKKDRRFTLEQAAAYASEQKGRNVSPSTLKANAKTYGFEIRERGSGMYALIDS
jgi:hypothetical protein